QISCARIGPNASVIRIPPHAPGMKIGLFGGTFDPPHEAHLAASLLALRRLDLDRVWWLVTPGNPLKDTRGLAPLPDRMAKAGALGCRPGIAMSVVECGMVPSFAYEAMAYRRAASPGGGFVGVMGANNPPSSHRWQAWREIAALVPLAAVGRLGPSLYATASA